MKQVIAQLLLAAAVCLGVQQAAFGQGATDTSKGALTIEIKDAMMATVPGAKVTVNGPLGAVNGTSDTRGEANFTALTPGMYSVTVSKTGFSTAKVIDIELQATQKLAVPVSLKVGQITQTVEVSGAADVIDVSASTVESSINSAEYANLPIGRNVTNLFYMAPGVAGGGGTGSANPSINGASGLENMYIIDGINDTDAGYGGFGVYSTNYGSLGSGVNFDFIKEVQVKTSGFDAQYGQAMGGVINVVTQSGSNAVHGSAYAYTNPGWAEMNYRQVNATRVGSPQTEIWGQHQYDFGVNVGGPFKKDKFFWYGAFNPTFNHVEENAAPGFSIRANGPYDLEHRSLNWVGKINYNITDTQHLEGTVFADPSKSPNAIQGPDPSGITGTAMLRNNLDSLSSLDYGTRNWAAKYSGSFGASTIVSASFGWNHSYFTETPSTNTFQIRNYALPTATALYTLQGGVGNLNNNQGDNKQVNLMATRTVNFFGGHTFDVGYSSNNVDYSSIQEYTGPQFALPKANGIAAGDVGKLVNGAIFFEYANRAVNGVTYPLVYRLYRGYFSSPNVSTKTKYQDVFAQDAWQVNKMLTVKAGVRWEQQRLNGNVNKYTMGGNWAPRIGLIIDPFRDGKTKVYGNYGLFFEKIPQDLAVRAMSSEQSYLNGYFLALPNGTSVQPVPGTTFAPNGVDPTIIYGGTKAAYEQQVSFGFEHEFSNSVVLRASFTDSTLKRGLEDTSGITVEQFNAGAPQQYVITNPNAALDIFHNAITCTNGKPNCTNGSGYTDDSGALGADGKADGFPDMRRVYNALEISVDKRFSNKWSLTSNYRVAKLFGNYEGSFRNDNTQSDPNITSLFDFVNSPALADQFKVGILPTDRTHIINAFANYMVRSNLNFGVGLTAQSGTPVSQFDAHPGYLNSGEIPVGGRGSEGRTPWGTYVDFRAGYDRKIGEMKKLKLSADLFNLFDRTTTVLYDQNAQLSGGTPNPDFLKPLTAHRPFRAQFSVRFEF